MTPSFNPSNIFGYYAPLYQERSLPVVPVVSGTKRAAVKEWQRAAELGVEARRGWIDRFSDQSIGLLAGTTLTTGRRLCFIDVDHDGFVAFVTAVIGSVVCAKFGSKGLTIFAQANPEIKSAKLKPKSGKSFAVEIFADSGMTVLPPSPHPSGATYSWCGEQLLESEHSELPILDAKRFEILSAVARHACAWEIVEGGANTKGHDLMLTLTSSGIAGLTEDLDWLADCLNALFHQDYAGNTRSETLNTNRR
jgi:hypothetical protein